MPLDGAHTLNQTGHTADHNLIDNELALHDSSISALQVSMGTVVTLETATIPPAVSTIASTAGDEGTITASKSTHTHALSSHTHLDGPNGNKLTQDATHESCDVNNNTGSYHHTLGTDATMAAAGDHGHGTAQQLAPGPLGGLTGVEGWTDVNAALVDLQTARNASPAALLGSFATADARDIAVPSAPDGMICYLLNDDIFQVRVAGAWTQFLVGGNAWTTYTPVWTCSTVPPALGNGTLVGKYSKLGRQVTFNITLVMGNTTTMGVGGGSWSFTTPFPAANLVGTVGRFIGSIWCQDVSGGLSYVGTSGISLYSDTIWSNFQLTAGAASGISSSVPFTWANGDMLSIQVTYESEA